jgi:hypothetical protein
MLEATGMLHDSYVRYREVIKDVKERRITFINDLATAKAKAGKISVANALQSLQEQEAVRETWGRIHRMDGSAHVGKRLSMVMAPNEEGEWTERVTRGDIEQATLKENEKRFTQSKNTTLMVSPMVEELGLLGIGSAADDILDGTYSPPADTSPELANVLQHLQCPPQINRLKQPAPITCEDYKHGWREVKESISSSPSRIHVGH